MKQTLLQLTQTILSSMDSDEISSITDTVEAQQVVEVIKTVYDAIIAKGEFPIQCTLFNLTASGSNTKPTLMTKPDDINDIQWIRYDRQIEDASTSDWATLTYLPVDTFLSRMYSLDTSEDTVGTFDHSIGSSTVTFFYRNDGGPQVYTSYDDNTIIFDSYDSDVDTTLQSSKSLAYGEKALTFTNSDSWTPSLHPHQFPLLLNEAKALAWAELKQVSHAKAEKTARDQWIHLQRTKRTVPEGQYDTGPNYGRK